MPAIIETTYDRNNDERDDETKRNDRLALATIAAFWVTFFVGAALVTVFA